MAKTRSLTPMLRHYLEVKSEHPEGFLFYRMGDFYELFFEDAEEAAPLLEVALTARHKGTDNEVPMCGVPHHAIDAYAGKLLEAGHKVVLCDQVEDPAKAKGLVKREVTRVLTPGTLSQPGLLEGSEDNLLASLGWDGEHGGGAFLDISTGRFFVVRWSSAEEAVEELELAAPREVLYGADELPEELERWIGRQEVCVTRTAPEDRPDARQAEEELLRQLDIATLGGYELEPGEPAVRAAAAALRYARETQRSDISHVDTLAVRQSTDGLLLDATTLVNLEVLRSLRQGGRRGSLLGVLDRTATPPGGRLIKEWLRRPLKEPEAIDRRLEAVGELEEDPTRRQRLRDALGRVGDPERLLARAVLGTMSPREAAALREGLARAPAILDDLARCAAPLLLEIADTDPLPELYRELERRLVESPSASVQDGGVIAEGLDPELDRHRSLARDTKKHILALEKEERERTGIGSLKIRFNKVFGYYVEVTKANQHLVPEEYIRKQTLVNAERYVTPEIKDLEERVLHAEERQIALEEEHFAALLELITETSAPIRRLAASLATLDVLVSLAEVAARQGYSRPSIRPLGDPIVIRDGRHPVVEALTSEPFVPNGVELDGESQQVIVLTGPNMGGKSTYLRQVALIVLMAQAGSFVPAGSAEIGVVDRIFTRVGASDDLARGESTFMVEMIETARILHFAGPHSLVILDEVGRGTATFDGLSLAWAIIEHLHERSRARTLFATHYHELTELAAVLPRVVNRTMTVKEWEDRIVFLRRVVPGSADQSYGIQVARLAGLPGEVVERARQVLDNLERQEYDSEGRPRRAPGGSKPEGGAQLQLFSGAEEVVARILREVDVQQLTPLAALNLLASLKDRLDGG